MSDDENVFVFVGTYSATEDAEAAEMRKELEKAIDELKV